MSKFTINHRNGDNIIKKTKAGTSCFEVANEEMIVSLNGMY